MEFFWKNGRGMPDFSSRARPLGVIVVRGPDSRSSESGLRGPSRDSGLVRDRGVLCRTRWGRGRDKDVRCQARWGRELDDGPRAKFWAVSPSVYC